MKNIKYIIALVICINNLTLFSQEKDTTQLHYYKLGIKKKDVRVAYNYFRKAYLESENTEIGKNSLVKADSLKLNLRQELLIKIIGVWKSKNDEKSVKNLLVISSESLVIYNCLNHNTQIEKLTFFEPKYYQ